MRALVRRRGGTRAALLLTAAVALGAANDAGLPDDARVRDAPVTGEYGDYLAGRFALRAGDAADAAPMLKAALALDPDGTELLTQALIASVVAGTPDQGLAAKLPGNLVARLVLLDVDALAGNWVSAQARAGSLPVDGVAQVLRPLLLAWTQAGAGQADDALATLAPLVAGPRLRGVYALHAGLIADGASRPGEAGRYYRIAQAEFGGMNLRLGQVLASWQMRLNHPDEAAAIIDATVAGAPDTAIARDRLLVATNTPAVRSPLDGIAETYLALAASIGANDRSDAAPALLQLALQVRPGFTAARIVLGDVLGLARHPEAALEALVPVPADDPLAEVVALRRGALLDDAKRPDEAIATLRALAEARPDRPEPYAALGDVERRASRFADAAEAYDKAVAALGTTTPASWTLFYERGVAFERSARWPQAQADFLHALELSPDQPLVLNYLGYAWTERGEQLPRARQMLERAASLRPEDGAIIDSLGWVLLRMGDTAEATARLERAVELQPEDASINGHLGDAYQAIGRLREAEFQWRRALNLNPDAEEKTRIEAKLHELPAP